MSESTVTLLVYVLDAILLGVLVNLCMALRNKIRNPQTSKKTQREDTRKRTLRMVLTGMFLAFGLALKFFSIEIPLFGSGGMRMSLGGIFTAFPALLFGPFYGGITSALSDILGFFMKPSGDYNFLFTLVAFIGGFIKGLLWKLLKKKFDGKKARIAKIAVVAVLAVIMFFGIFTVVSLRSDGVTGKIFETAEGMPSKEDFTARLENEKLGVMTRFMGKLVANKGAKSYGKNLALYYNMVGPGFVIASLVGFLILGTDIVIRKIREKKGKSTSGSDLFLRILICLLISGIIVTTINTEVLLKLYGIQVPFVIYWIPRLVEEIIVCMIQAYFVAILYDNLRRIKGIS